MRMSKVLGISQDGVSRLEKAQRSYAFHTKEERRSDGRQLVASC